MDWSVFNARLWQYLINQAAGACFVQGRDFFVNGKKEIGK